MPDFQIRPLTSADCDWVSRVVTTEWGSEIVVSHNKVFHPVDLPGFAAFIGDEPVGLVTYRITRNECEIVTLNSWCEGRGVGAALIDAVRKIACLTGCRRLYLVTTNNNLSALRFYKKRGFVISALRINAIADSRKLKRQIPLLDEDGRAIRDEIELEIPL